MITAIFPDSFWFFLGFAISPALLPKFRKSRDSGINDAIHEETISHIYTGGRGEERGAALGETAMFFTICWNLAAKVERAEGGMSDFFSI